MDRSVHAFRAFEPVCAVDRSYLGWRADQPVKLWIAGFAAAALSLMFETAVGLLQLPQPISQDAGALAMFPFRFIGGAAQARLPIGSTAGAGRPDKSGRQVPAQGRDGGDQCSQLLG
jgi:hypothetical protein